MCEVWPWHQDALSLLLACIGQFQLGIGMGGAHWRPAQAVNVAQEMHWMGIEPESQPDLRWQYRVMEQEALRVLNDREERAARQR